MVPARAGADINDQFPPDGVAETREVGQPREAWNRDRTSLVEFRSGVVTAGKSSGVAERGLDRPYQFEPCEGRAFQSGKCLFGDSRAECDSRQVSRSHIEPLASMPNQSTHTALKADDLVRTIVVPAESVIEAF